MYHTSNSVIRVCHNIPPGDYVACTSLKSDIQKGVILPGVFSLKQCVGSTIDLIIYYVHQQRHMFYIHYI